MTSAVKHQRMTVQAMALPLGGTFRVPLRADVLFLTITLSAGQPYIHYRDPGVGEAIEWGFCVVPTGGWVPNDFADGRFVGSFQTSPSKDPWHIFACRSADALRQ